MNPINVAFNSVLNVNTAVYAALHGSVPVIVGLSIRRITSVGGLCTNPSIERNADGAVCVRLRGARRARLAGIIMTAGLCSVRVM